MENGASRGQLEVALPLWDSLETTLKTGPAEEGLRLLCHCGILWREFGKLGQWRKV